jgi:predicted nucleic acid-binding protein
MRLFLDTNILLDVFLHRIHEISSKEIVLSCITGENDGWIAWHTLTNGYYVVYNHTKSRDEADLFLSSLLDWVEVAQTSTEIARQGLSFAITDREDAFQIAAALSCNADIIITRNKKDFTESTITVMTPEEFLQSRK